MIKKLLKITPAIFYILSFFILETFFNNEIFLTVIVLLFSWKVLSQDKYHEFSLYVFGLLVGLFIELFLGIFSRTQFWANTMFLPIPIWLPFIWAFGFVIIRRVGNILVEKE